MFTIRHIRTLLTTSIGLKKGGVKWEGLDSINSINGSQEAKTPDQLLDKAKELINKIKDKESWAITDWNRMVELRGIMNTLGTENQKKRESIMKEVEDVLSNRENLSVDDIRRFESLKEEWMRQYKNVNPNTVAFTEPVPAPIRIDEQLLGVPEEQSPVPVEDRPIKKSESPSEKVAETTRRSTSELKDNISRLADLNNDANIDSTLRDVVNEDVLKRALSRVTNGGDERMTKEVYRTVTGKEVTAFTPDEVKEFQNKLRASLVIIQKLTGGNAGLYGLLKGELGAYATEIKKLDPKPVVKVDEMKGLTPGTQTLLGGLATVGVLVLTQGIVMVGHSANTISPEKVLEDLDRSTLGKAWEWVKDAFTGRRLAFSLGQDKMSVREYKDKIQNFAKDILTGDPQIPEAKDIYGKAQKIAADLGMGDNKDAIQKAAIQAYVQNLGVENAGSDWTAKIGLLFIGANRDAINPTALKTYYSKFNETEATLTRRMLTSAELTAAGVKIQRVDGKYQHTIPSEIKLPGDDQALPVILPAEVNLASAEKVYDLRFSDRGDGKYILSTTERKDQPKIGPDGNIAPRGDMDGKQSVSKVRNARESKEKLDKNQLATMLYEVVGHSKPEVFGPLLSAIKTRDTEEVSKIISSIEKSGYTALGKMLRKDIANYETWPTYMYGTRNTRMRDNPTQSGVDKLRGADVLNAEKRLADAAGINFPDRESDFSVGKNEKHTPTQVSAVFPGQEMTVSVFATPRGGKHRIDAFDGSIAMSTKYVELPQDYKDQVIEAMKRDSGKGGIKAQVEKLNKFLKERNKPVVDIQKYVEYLKTGDIKDLGVPELQVQKGKDTRVFEGRAMVAGNVCMNRMYGIVYPAFELSGDRQSVAPAGQMDATATLNMVGVEAEQSSGGISTVGLFAKVHNMVEKNGAAKTHLNQGGGTGGSGAGGSGSGAGGASR